MTRYTRDEMLTFLKAVDRYAPAGSKVVIIGGAAATLSFGATGGTVDIDTANKIPELAPAGEEARKETGLGIPLAYATAYEAPRDFERRLKPLRLPGLKKLKVFIPEKHDWALTKIVRLEDKDLAHLQAAKRNVGLDLRTLEKRFLEEMTHVLPRERIVAHFLAMIEELYGDPAAARLEATLRKHPLWK